MKNIIFLIAILALIGVMMVVFGLQKKEQPIEEMVIESIIPKETATTTTEVSSEIDTSNWKTYRNEEFGFEVKYQPYWQTGTYDIVGIQDKRFIPMIFNQYDSNQNTALPLLNFTISDKGFNFPNENYFKDELIHGNLFKIYKSSEFLGFNYYTEISLKNNFYFLIKVGQIESNDEALNRFREIISTFRFFGVDVSI